LQRLPKLYYGWIIVAVAFITLGVSFGVWYSYSVFILGVIAEFGWTRAAASSVFSIFILTQALAGTGAGFLQDRFGPRLVIPAGAVLLALSLVLTSLARNLWQFQLAYGVLAGASISLLGFVSNAAFLPRWFERRRGLAIGIAMAGIGFGMLLIVPLAEKLITLFGWRTAYLFLAGIVLLLVAPVNLVFARRGPEAVNQFPDGDTPDSRGQQVRRHRMVRIIDHAWAAEEWTLLKALHTRRFWLLACSFFFISYAFQGILLHSVSSMVDSGMDRNHAAYFFGIAGFAGSFGKIIFGYLSDVLGRELAKIISDIVALLGIVSLMAVAVWHTPMAILFGLFFGLGYGGAAPLIPSVTADIFLGRHFGVIFAIIAIGSGIGGATGTFLAGWLRDFTGTYSVPFLVCCGSLVLSSVLVFLAGPGKIRRLVVQERI